LVGLQHKFVPVLVYGSWLNGVTKAAASINFQPELVEREENLRVKI